MVTSAFPFFRPKLLSKEIYFLHFIISYYTHLQQEETFGIKISIKYIVKKNKIKKFVFIEEYKCIERNVRVYMFRRRTHSLDNLLLPYHTSVSLSLFSFSRTIYYRQHWRQLCIETSTWNHFWGLEIFTLL